VPVNPDFRDLFSELNAADARYLVVGAHAVTFHSVPRYTKDIDIWIEPSRENAAHVFSALSRFGAPIERLNVEDLRSPGVVFQIGVEPNRIDVLTSIKGLEFGEAWSRRAPSAYGGVPINVLGLEDLIASKKAAGRPQDMLDVDWLEKSRRT
jgi:uncharacterized nucleotidyltransferase DUF6036